MIFYRVFPDPRLAIDLDTAEGLERLQDLYRLDGSPSVRVNMIVRPDGSLTGSDGTSSSLSSPQDRRLVGVLRTMADVVIIGAETLRHERIPVPPGAPLMVVSRSGHIAAHNVIFGQESGELVVVTPSPETASQALDDTPHRLIDPGSPSATPHEIVDICREAGWERILVEGGQDIFTQFAEAGLIDDLCLTLTGAPLSDEIPPVAWWPKGTTWITSHLLMDDYRVLYHRYGAEPSSP